MKSILIFVLSLLCVQICFSQKCKFIKKEIIDSVSGLPILYQDVATHSKYYIHSRSASWTSSLCLYYSTNRQWINLHMAMGRLYKKKVTIHSKDPIILYFSDSTSMSLYPPESINVKSKYVTTVPIFLISGQYDAMTYPITKENVEILTSKELKKVRVYYTRAIDDRDRNENNPLNDEFVEIEISRKKIKFFQFLSKCILSTQ